jgi:hypothetical protein
MIGEGKAEEYAVLKKSVETVCSLASMLAAVFAQKKALIIISVGASKNVMFSLYAWRRSGISSMTFWRTHAGSLLSYGSAGL